MVSSSPSLNNSNKTSSTNLQTNLTSLSEASTTSSYSDSTCNSLTNTSSSNNISNDNNSDIPSFSSTNTVVATQGSSYYNDHLVGNGHFFTKKTFHKLTYCHHCTEMLWGIISQGLVCEGKLLNEI
jgi:hypothetical protein